MKKHISKNGQGKITSKVAKPKDWAFRTPSEGRPKSVHSRRCKPIRMDHVFWESEHVIDKLIFRKVGTKMCEWNVSCENPARTLTAQDVLDVIHSVKGSDLIEVKHNHDNRLIIFVDLTDYLTGGHDEEMKEAAIACEHLDKELKRERNKKK